MKPRWVPATRGLVAVAVSRLVVPSSFLRGDMDYWLKDLAVFHAPLNIFNFVIPVILRRVFWHNLKQIHGVANTWNARAVESRLLGEDVLS